MTAALVAGAFGLLGTVLGFVITIRAARENADRADKRAHAALIRDEFRLAVVEFASAALTSLTAEMDRWHADRGGGRDPRQAAEAVYGARTAAVHAQNVLELSTYDVELIRRAGDVVDKAAAIHRLKTKKEMDELAREVREEVATLVRLARNQVAS
jgi:uncharacterized small protein (DUF1192 family)